jgi:hypothetical protein
MQQQYRQCPGCKINYMRDDTLTNTFGVVRYGVSSQECQQAFNELLGKEAMEFGYPPVHRLIVDAYAVQHPPHSEYQHALGIEKRFIEASIQSVVVHLFALYLAIEKKIPLLEISDHMSRFITYMDNQKIAWPELTPPDSVGMVMIPDLMNATNAQEYDQLAWQWALSAWNAWSEHHDLIYQLYEKCY